MLSQSLGQKPPREGGITFHRHCERSEAIHIGLRGETFLDCFASLAMTTGCLPFNSEEGERGMSAEAMTRGPLSLPVLSDRVRLGGLRSLLLLRADPADALDRQHPAAAFLGDLAILLENESARRFVAVEPAEQF